jgi:hypothetical protein
MIFSSILYRCWKRCCCCIESLSCLVTISRCVSADDTAKVCRFRPLLHHLLLWVLYVPNYTHSLSLTHTQLTTTTSLSSIHLCSTNSLNIFHFVFSVFSFWSIFKSFLKNVFSHHSEQDMKVLHWGKTSLTCTPFYNIHYHTQTLFLSLRIVSAFRFNNLLLPLLFGCELLVLLDVDRHRCYQQNLTVTNHPLVRVCYENETLLPSLQLIS